MLRILKEPNDSHTEDHEVKCETERRERYPSDRGILAREHVGAAMRNVAGNWAGISLKRKIQRVHHSCEREQRNRRQANLHL
jgi:hypothetical protein